MKNILVVDDDEQMRNLLRDLLDGTYKVSFAENGRKALNMLYGDTFDMVITDLLMPEMDGIELVAYLREKNKKLKIIGISGGDKKGFFGYLRMMELLGADKTFDKPFDVREVRDAVNLLLA